MHGQVCTRAEKNSLVWPWAYTRLGLKMGGLANEILRYVNLGICFENAQHVVLFAIWMC